MEDVDLFFGKRCHAAFHQLINILYTLYIDLHIDIAPI